MIRLFEDLALIQQLILIQSEEEFPRPDLGLLWSG